MITMRIGRRIFGLAVACALAAGATQAVASPQQGAAGYGFCDAWPSQRACIQFCAELGYPGGVCESPYGDCICRDI